MSLADFVHEHVSPAETTDFVVRQDLLDAFTDWRQGREPIMQLKDLEQATADSAHALPRDAFVPTLTVVNDNGTRGALEDCWVGWKMDWAGGDKAQPKMLPPPHAGPVGFSTVTEPPVPDRKVHFCFHFNTRDGYDPAQFQQYTSTRVASTAPDDLEGLEEAVKHAFHDLRDQQATPWRVKHVFHEGVVFNVFVAYREEPLDIWSEQASTSDDGPVPADGVLGLGHRLL